MRVLLHVGTHKTGTTSIQYALARNREWLWDQGFVFPALGKVPGHNNFADGLARATRCEIDAFRAAILKDTKPNSTLVLSAEEFSTQLVGANQWVFNTGDYWEQRRDYVSRLKLILRDFEEIGVFLCFRRHDEFAQSLYATNLLNDRFRCSFSAFIRRCAPLFDYRAIAQTFNDSFSDVHIAAFEHFKRDLVNRFCSWTGLPLLPEAVMAKEVTPDWRLIDWLYRYAKTEDPKAFKVRASFARSNARAFELPGVPISLWHSEQELEKFLANCVEPEPGFFGRFNATVLGTLNEKDACKIEAMFNIWRQKPPKVKRSDWFRLLRSRVAAILSRAGRQLRPARIHSDLGPSS